MIEKMNSVCVVSSASRSDFMLSELRKLGVFHVRTKKNADESAVERFSALSAVCSVLSEVKGCSADKPVLTGEEFEKMNCSVVRAIEDRKKYAEEASRISVQIDNLREWGDFSPSDLAFLAEQGFPLFFYRISEAETNLLRSDENIRFIRLFNRNRTDAVAVIGKPLDGNYSAFPFRIPEKGLSELKSELGKCKEAIQAAEEVIKNASSELASYNAALLNCSNETEMSCVRNSLDSGSGLVWLSGYIPESDLEKFREKAAENCWAYAVEAADISDELVPTKIKYNGFSKLMKPVFGLLGTVPGYGEFDISSWFLVFLSLFFAMIMGDAGYGFCFLAVAAFLHIKQKKASDIVLLIYIVSLVTIGWGAVTGTWFGLESAMKIPLLRKFVIPSLANYPQYFGKTEVMQQNSMMKFCFMLGTVQLSLGCLISMKRKIRNRDCSVFADLGWFMIINALYYVVLLLVIGENVNAKICALVILSGFVTVCVFGGMEPGKSFSSGLKAGLGDAFTVFLDTISAFGNLMSYIRLFAVGLASLAIAQSFNDMAAGFSGAFRIFGLLIFILGHSLNLIMGLLSVLVHGVRLNLLEFSGQLGMEWAGIAYDPFRINKNGNR